MEVLIQDIWGDIKYEEVTGSIRTYLNEKTKDNKIKKIRFFEKKWGTTVPVAEYRYFNYPILTIYYTRLSVTKQKKFVGFVQDTLTDNPYGKPVGLEFIDNRGYKNYD